MMECQECGREYSDNHTHCDSCTSLLQLKYDHEVGEAGEKDGA